MTGYTAEEVAKFENETWSRCANSYMAGFGPLVRAAIEPLLDKVSITAGERVLDEGTGPGLVAEAIAERQADVVGIDFSDAMLAVARQLHPDLDFKKASAEKLPFQDNEFDVVVGNFILHHSGAPEKVLSEAYRVLSKNGRMGYTVWADPAKLTAFNIYFSAIEEQAGSADLPHGPLFGISDFSVFHRMARQAGFRDTSVIELELSWQTRSLEPYLAAFRDWANLDAFPKELRNPIEASACEKAESYRVNGHYSMPNPGILISAIK